MRKVYLSIIAFLLMIIVTMFFTQKQDNSAIHPDGSKEYLNQVEQSKATTSGVKNIQERFEEYFSGVAPKSNIFEGRKGVSIQVQDIPESEKKAYAAALLIEAQKSINVQGDVEVPTQENMEEFFHPTDQQLKDLLHNQIDKLSTNIVQKTVMLNDARRLIEDELIQKHLESIYKNLVDIEIYNKDSLYEFSIALGRYKESVDKIIQLGERL
ncbi:hypothetical protein [Radiobacillus deserti]|uniref:Uncharacterized protein n=1 Tax=Radiobacillus deserti TaxID=2594883 RepID=A0A516KIC9_9BACI|nr:hypothetical protein [Radiobacillus deserti]QDP41157.1 hypothetical protein FN924_13745 [Radiobacillus deserti]